MAEFISKNDSEPQSTIQRLSSRLTQKQGLATAPGQQILTEYESELQLLNHYYWSTWSNPLQFDHDCLPSLGVRDSCSAKWKPPLMFDIIILTHNGENINNQTRAQDTLHKRSTTPSALIRQHSGRQVIFPRFWMSLAFWKNSVNQWLFQMGCLIKIFPVFYTFLCSYK